MLACAADAVVDAAVVDLARRDVVDEPWFLVVLVGVVVGLLGVTSCVVVAVLYQRHVSRARKSSKQPVLDGQCASTRSRHSSIFRSTMFLHYN